MEEQFKCLCPDCENPMTDPPEGERVKAGHWCEPCGIGVMLCEQCDEPMVLKTEDHPEIAAMLAGRILAMPEPEFESEEQRATWKKERERLEGIRKRYSV